MSVRDAKARALESALAPYLKRAGAAQAAMVSARRLRDSTLLELFGEGVPVRLLASATGLSEQGVRSVLLKAKRKGTE